MLNTTPQGLLFHQTKSSLELPSSQSWGFLRDIDLVANLDNHNSQTIISNIKKKGQGKEGLMVSFVGLSIMKVTFRT